MRRPGKGKVASSSSSKQELSRIERHRTERMSEFYTELQTMVPNLFPRATRTRIVDETISYVKALEEVITSLNTQRTAMLLQQQQQSISMAVSGRTAFFGWRVVSHPGQVTKVAEVFEKHRADILAATVVAGDNGFSNVTVTALLSQEEGAAERIKADLMAI